MSALDDILQSLPLDQLATTLGTDQDTAEQSARQGIASLLGGLQNNAGHPDGEASLARALEQHQNSKFTGDGQVSVDDVDTEDGAKVVHHVLGSNTDQAAGLLNGPAGKQLLAILAPIVLGYVAKQVGGGKYGDILGSVLGNRPAQGQPQGQPSPGISLRDILGQFMGGGR